MCSGCVGSVVVVQGIVTGCVDPWGVEGAVCG